jgi:serine/threonine protein kinase
VIGKGGFGRVWKVERMKSRELLAMKEMSKARVMMKRCVQSVLNERKLLEGLEHPLIVNMQLAFQDRDNLYLAMDLMTGGDLRYHHAQGRTFSEAETSKIYAEFIIANIVAGLTYIHSQGIIHRDIKPENLVFDSDGYVHITDFGIAKVWRPDNSKDTSGTPGYMAPEVICRNNHGVAADYYAVGVIAYEFMKGSRPYTGRTRKEIQDSILAKQVQVKPSEVPEGWSLESADFINRVRLRQLIQRKPVNRLGLNGPDEVMLHPWLRDFPFDELLVKAIKAPFVPRSDRDNFDARLQFDNDPWKDSNSDALAISKMSLRRDSAQAMFAGYFFDRAAAVESQLSS